MNKVLPKYASAFIDNRGRERIRLRRTGWPSIYVNAKVGTPEFTAAYKAWEASKIAIGAAKIRPGSFDDLITRFYKSRQWSEIKPKTQYTYRGELERFRAKYGDRLVAGMTARHIDNLMLQMSGTPSAANNLKKRLAQLFDFAARLEWRTDNPARLVASVKTNSTGYKTWPEELIEQYQAHWPVGTMPRLAFDLALYTGQRRNDVRVMGPQHVRNGEIRVVQEKTGKLLWIPLAPELARSIEATPCGDTAFLVRNDGSPFTEKGFGMWFMRQCRAAGIMGYSMHGLRKSCAARLAEQGHSNQVIKAITGHTTDTEVARYTRDASQQRRARIAIPGSASGLVPDLSSVAESAGNAG